MSSILLESSLGSPAFRSARSSALPEAWPLLLLVSTTSSARMWSRVAASCFNIASFHWFSRPLIWSSILLLPDPLPLPGAFACPSAKGAAASTRIATHSIRFIGQTPSLRAFGFGLSELSYAASAVAAVYDRRSALPYRAGFERRYNLCRSVIVRVAHQAVPTEPIRR